MARRKNKGKGDPPQSGGQRAYQVIRTLYQVSRSLNAEGTWTTKLRKQDLGEPDTWQYLWAVPEYAPGTKLEIQHREIVLSLWIGSSPPDFRLNEFTWPNYPTTKVRLLGDFRAGAGRPNGEELPIKLERDRDGYLDRIVSSVSVPAISLTTPKASSELITMNVPSLFDAASNFLSAISMKLDQPLEIHHVTAYDSASGVQWTRYKVPISETYLRDLVIGPFGQQFQQAIALFREGLNSPNPAYQVLSFYKVAKLVLGDGGVQGIRRRVNEVLKKQGVTDTSRPKLTLDGQPYGEVLKELTKERDRIGHGMLDDGSLRSPDSWEDLNQLWDAADKLRIIARQLLNQEENALNRLGPTRGTIRDLP